MVAIFIADKLDAWAKARGDATDATAAPVARSSRNFRRFVENGEASVIGASAVGQNYAGQG